MDTRTKAEGFPKTPAMEQYLQDRLAHIEKLLGDAAENTRCEVELSRDAGRPRHGANIWCAEIQIIRPGHPTVRATNNSESLNGAIDDAKAEVERQLRAEKSARKSDERKKGSEAKELLREE